MFSDKQIETLDRRRVWEPEHGIHAASASMVSPRVQLPASPVRQAGARSCAGGLALAYLATALLTVAAAEARPEDPQQALERTCFQTAAPYSDIANLRSDVAIVYGIDPGLPARIQTWRECGYRIHVMTGVSWGQYQDYLYGRFDGVNHEDEAQTDRQGKKISHGGDVYYMCPAENYGKFLTVGVQRALDAGAEAIHLEEPEFWVRGGYSEGFKREWQQYYGEEWTPPHTSVDAQWRASKLKYHLYRRALQQVFDYVQDYNQNQGRHVRCYVPTHSLLNYAHWRIVSPESSLARLRGCDGYIAQVWTGTARTPNLYRGQMRERTFETAFLEYGAMQNLVRATGRRVWYLNDPVEDNPNHDWDDYRRNWESTLVASLLQPEVWRFEVMPWPERVFGGRYPSRADPKQREPMPPAYATEVQTVINALNELNQPKAEWDCGTTGVGVMVSDSLMFERGEPQSSDAHLSHIYGLALPLLKRGIPVTPVQLENLPISGCLDQFRLLLMTYQGMKPLSPEAHQPLARWVRAGGVLVFWDDDSDPYNRVREWWNSGGLNYASPRAHLFAELGVGQAAKAGRYQVGKGVLVFRAANPASLAADPAGDTTLVAAIQEAIKSSRVKWRQTNYLLLRRGKYVIAAGLDESAPLEPKVLRGRFLNLFDPELAVQAQFTLAPGNRFFLLDLDQVSGAGPHLLASACKALVLPPGPPNPDKVSAPTGAFRCVVEGVARTEAVVLLRLPRRPCWVSLAGQPLASLPEPDAHSPAPGRAPQGLGPADNRADTRGRRGSWSYDAAARLLWVKFPNEPRPRELATGF